LIPRFKTRRNQQKKIKKMARSYKISSTRKMPGFLWREAISRARGAAFPAEQGSGGGFGPRSGSPGRSLELVHWTISFAKPTRSETAPHPSSISASQSSYPSTGSAVGGGEGFCFLSAARCVLRKRQNNELRTDGGKNKYKRALARRFGGPRVGAVCGNLPDFKDLAFDAAAASSLISPRPKKARQWLGGVSAFHKLSAAQTCAPPPVSVPRPSNGAAALLGTSPVLPNPGQAGADK